MWQLALRVALGVWLALVSGRAALAQADDMQRLAFVARALGIAEADVNIEVGDGMGWRLRSAGQTLGYLGSTWEISRTAGYSGRPVDILVLVDMSAKIRGTLLVRQEEPVLTLGIAPERIARYVDGFANYDLRNPLTAQSGAPQAIAGATISSGVIGSGIVSTGRRLAEHHGLLAAAGERSLNMAPGEAQSWESLLHTGALARLSVTAAEADRALGVAGSAAPASAFAELFVAVADPPPIGRSLLGDGAYASLMSGLGAGAHALFVAGNGLYSFKGTKWKATGYFDRIEVVQGSKTIRLTADQHKPLESVAAVGAPELRERALFAVPKTAGFDATLPFRLTLLASRDDNAGLAHLARFELDYKLPAQYVRAAAVAADAGGELWQASWRARWPGIAVVAAMLLGLYLILIFQNQIAARPRLYRRLRLGYLAATVVLLGGVFGAQLSVVHVLTFAQALRTEFSWQTFLLDPLIFILWGWLAVALLFWGRVYCGWLCPFGALQELLNKLAQRLGVRQFTVPFILHERLWPIKYIVFLGLFAASFSSMTLAFTGAEVEPFKTAVTFRFMREWPFVAFALALLAAGLFVERFFCRYVCPLGAALAIPARLRMFEWLKRRPQCGRECRICSTKCPVQAIHPEGQINPNECIYCLNCQTLYHDETICPPLKVRATRRPDFTRSASNVT